MSTTTSAGPGAAFVAALPPIERSHPLLQAAAPAESTIGNASVVGNSLVAFTSGLDATHQTAVLYATGYAQLQATNPAGPFKKDPKTDPVGYFNDVVTILTNIGFVMGSYDFANYTTKAQTLQLDNVVLQIMGEVLTAPELAVVNAAISALKASADAGDAPWTIYNSTSHSQNTGGYSQGLATQTTGPDGSTSVAVKLSAYTFSGVDTTTDFLWMHYSSTELKLQTAQSTLVINDDLWNRPGVGNAISSAMAAHSAGYIANLPPLQGP